MNVLFLCLGKYDSIKESGIYTDLLRKFIEEGHDVFMLCSINVRETNRTVIHESHSTIAHVYTGKITKTNIIQKGINTLRITERYKAAIKRHFSGVHFDLILYPTPPITLAGVVKYVKKRDHAQTYLMLKDIFPQNAVDLGMMTKTGAKSIIYKVFRKKEKQLYALSDTIGCMSQANVDFVLKHNPEISADRVEICPNCIEVQNVSITPEQKLEIRKKYEIPLDKKVFVYGGNLGKPQGIPFLIECLKSQLENPDAFFLVVGDGTEYPKLQQFMEENHPQNMKLLKRIPKHDYDRMIYACDVGMIFLDHRFTIPNFPSRLLAYLQAGLPILACTDLSSDIGKVIVENNCGWWCPSDDTTGFSNMVNKACVEYQTKQLNCKKLLREQYTVEKEYNIIMKRTKE